MNSLKHYLNTVTFGEFQVKFDELIANKTSFYGYFYGGYDESGSSWCSDCVTAKPIIEEASKILENQDKVLFFRFPVDSVSDWKNSKCIFRTHSKVKLDRVPTLIYFQAGLEYGRLIEGELFDKSNVEEFIKQSLE
jgi:thiol-disulfide isomerase/thioredoxin